MKKLLLLFVGAIMTAGMASAQCTPDPAFTEPGVYPDSATGFENACVGVPYQQLITNVVPVDTTVDFGGFPITVPFDSVVITNVLGLPPGFTYVCYDGGNVTSPVDGCAFEGGTTGCVLISGTSSPGDEAVYNLTIEISAWMGILGEQLVPVDYYSIEVQSAASCTAGIDKYTLTELQVYPNPVDDNFTLKGLDGMNVEEITIVNMDGRIMKSFNNVSTSTFDMDASGLAEGIYFVQIKHDGTSDVVKFAKK